MIARDQGNDKPKNYWFDNAEQDVLHHNFIDEIVNKISKGYRIKKISEKPTPEHRYNVEK